MGAVRGPAAVVRAAHRPRRSPSAPAAAAGSGRKIKARLFYVSEDGTRLTGVERDVAYGDGPAAQAEEIVKAQIAPVAAPLRVGGAARHHVARAAI